MISVYDTIVAASTSVQCNQSKILCVGYTCIDIIQTCNEFPVEDSDQRSVEYRWQRGGNASNTCTVLSLLGTQCEFFGSFSAEQHLDFLQSDMRKYNIDFSHCPEIKGVGCPISTVILSLSSGSRTILHHNPNLPYVTLEDFKCLKLQDYNWIHFEGRNITEVLSMMQHVKNYNKSINSSKKRYLEKSPVTISIELENPKIELLNLLPHADVAFISKDFAQSRGYNNMSETLEDLCKEAKAGAIIICAWADRGAMACTSDGIIVQSPAFPPQIIVDTLGAGDTFNAAVLHYLNKMKFHYKHLLRDHNEKQNSWQQKDNILNFIDKKSLQSAITFGCQVAGAKVGIKGYDGLQGIVETFYQGD